MGPVSRILCVDKSDGGSLGCHFVLMFAY